MQASEAYDARATLAVADREVVEALREGDPMGIRQAAEKVYLAASQAIDTFAAWVGERPYGPAQRNAFLQRHAPDLANRFGQIRAQLHGDCFHDGMCDQESLRAGLENAAAIIAIVDQRFGFDPMPPARVGD